MSRTAGYFIADDSVKQDVAFFSDDDAPISLGIV